MRNPTRPSRGRRRAPLIVGLSSRQGDGPVPALRLCTQHTVGTVSGEVEKLREEVARARDREIAELRARLKVYEAQKIPPPPPSPTAATPPPTSSTRQLWYWTDLVMDSLRPFQQLSGGITREGLRLAEQKCKTSTYCHRAQVIGGRLYVTDLRAIFFDRNYAMARVLPLLETLKRWPVPDFDAVFQGTDYPLGELPRDPAHMERMYGPGKGIPPMFSPTATTVHLDIPWPDFAFWPPRGRNGVPHPLRTPRWEYAHGELLAKGRKIPWEQKIDRAVFTGNMMGTLRQEMYALAEANPSVMFVNEVFIKAKSYSSCFEMGFKEATQGGVLSKKCGLAFEDLCRYKYLINLGSNGYANKLRFLFLCGSTVLWVRKGSLNHEFFERQFLPGVHYAPVDTVEDLPAAIHRLRADDAFARRIALAGQARMAQMDVDEVTHYCYQMLKGYAALQRFAEARPALVGGQLRDDLVRHYALRRSARRAELVDRYLTEDNATCLRPPPAGMALGPPGGAWAGSHVSPRRPRPERRRGEGRVRARAREKGGDGPDWDIPEAYKGGALPDWKTPDPADVGKETSITPWTNVRTVSATRG